MPNRMGHDVTGRAGTNTTCHSTGSKAVLLAAGASPRGSAKEGSRLTVPRELETWAAGWMSGLQRPQALSSNHKHCPD